jgi:YbbR domain-containing protein
VETVGEVPPGHLLDSVEVPQKITIKGPKDVLKDIREVTADPINIAGLTETVKIPLKITLPGGAEVAEESMGLLVVVSIKGLGASKLTFSSKEIKINNLKEGLQVHVNDGEIAVIAKSKNGNSTNLSLRDVNPYIEGKGLEPGTRKVKIMSAPSKGVESVVFSPDEVEITISEV